jgi:predicted negative regulator of RcsB-dependent stress response
MRQRPFASLKNILQKSIKTQTGQRKVLLLVAGVLLALVVFRTGWTEYSQYNQEVDQQIDMKKMEYQKLVKLVSKGDQFKELNKELNQFKNNVVDKRFIQAATPALAEAKFQNLVNQLAEENAVRVLSVRVLPRQEAQYFNILKIGINCRAEIGAIKDFLKKIRDKTLFVFFDELEIKRINRREERFFNFNAQLLAWTEK